MSPHHPEAKAIKAPPARRSLSPAPPTTKYVTDPPRANFIQCFRKLDPGCQYSSSPKTPKRGNLNATAYILYYDLTTIDIDK